MSKRSCVTQISLFLVFIFAFFFLNIAKPDKEFSQQENRYLAALPGFSLERLFSGRFTKEFEAYTTDQFAFRNSWITLKARSELALRKKENNGIYILENGVLIQRFEQPDQQQLDSNIAAVNELCQNSELPVYLALVPGAAEIWRDKLPKNAPGASQLELMTYVYKNSRAVPVDVYSSLKGHKDEYIFYHTDHHWTSLGAYYGYTALMEKLGCEYPPLTSYDREIVSTDFYGTVYSSSGASWVPPDSIETFVQPSEEVQVVNFPQGDPVTGQIYDKSFLMQKDKYSMFMGGNTPLLQINTGVESSPSLLIVRDSYIDGQIPFLLEHFSQIHVVDLRYYRASLSGYIQENQIDQILICYSVSNFAADNNLFMLGH